MREIQRIDPLEEALEREKYWIKHYLDLGHPLHNMKVARSILKEQARLEKLAKKSKKVIQKRAPLYEMNELADPSILSPKQQLALQFYQEGKRSVRALAAAMSASERFGKISRDGAYQLLIQLENAGHIRRSHSGSEYFQEYRESLLPSTVEAWEQGYKTVTALAQYIGVSRWHAHSLIKEIKKVHATTDAVS